MSTANSTRLSLLALASAVLGLFCITGPIALFCGLVSLRTIHASDGRLRGAPLAVFGLVAGGIGTVLVVLGTLAMGFQTLREKSNRVECQNNLAKIALAVNVYADNEGHKFPPATLPLADTPPDRRLSWYAGELPYLEERPGQPSPWHSLADKVDFGKPWDAGANEPLARANVPRFLCRSHPHYDPRGTPGLTHYVGISGIGTEAATLPLDDPRAGFFGYDRVLKPEKVTAGASRTLLAVETTADNGPWIAGGPPTVRGVDPDETHYIGTGRPFGGCHRNGAVDLLPAAYADASVRFITSSIEPGIFRDSARVADVAERK